jgi:hypothetical protein
MPRASILCLAAALALCAAAAQAAEPAATLTAVKGAGVIGAGSGFTPAKAGAALEAGDRVVAKAGELSLRYADGCTVTVPANGMATIAGRSPCAGGPGLVQAGGSSALLGMSKWGPGAYFAGAGALVIGGAVIYGLTDPTGDDPVSP